MFLKLQANLVYMLVRDVGMMPLWMSVNSFSTREEPISITTVIPHQSSVPILEVLWALLIVVIAFIEGLESLAVLWQEQVSNFHWALFLRDTVGKRLARACQCFSFSPRALYGY